MIIEYEYNDIPVFREIVGGTVIPLPLDDDFKFHVVDIIVVDAFRNSFSLIKEKDRVTNEVSYNNLSPEEQAKVDRITELYKEFRKALQSPNKYFRAENLVLIKDFKINTLYRW